MKRIVKCPKCEAKLAIFDLGKPINQKCPKCGNAFVIESEEKKEPTKSDEAVGSVKLGNDAAKKVDPLKSDVKPADADVKVADSVAQKEKAADKQDDKAPGQKGTSAKKSEGADQSAVNDLDYKEPAAKEKEITLKKPVERPGGTDKPMEPSRREPIASSALDDMAHQAASGGPSPIFPMVVMGLLILVIAMQLMMKLRADKQYKTLIDHLQYIEKKMK